MLCSVLNSIQSPKIGLYGDQLQNFTHIFALTVAEPSLCLDRRQWADGAKTSPPLALAPRSGQGNRTAAAAHGPRLSEESGAGPKGMALWARPVARQQPPIIISVYFPFVSVLLLS